MTRPRTRPAYPTEYREQIVALARSGRSVEDLAREFEPCAHTIYAWVDAGPMLVHRQAYAGLMPATLLDAMAFHVMVLPFIMFAYVVGGHNAERYSTWRRKRELEKIKRNVGDGI